MSCRTMCLCCCFNFFPFESLIWCLLILFAPPQLLQVSSHLPSHPAFLFLLLPSLHLSSCPICIAQILHPLNCAQPTRGHTCILTADSSCKLPFILCFPLCTGILSGLSLQRSCSCYTTTVSSFVQVPWCVWETLSL